jgi:hypothetical protein
MYRHRLHRKAHNLCHRKLSKRNTSGVTGVHWVNGTYDGVHWTNCTYDATIAGKRLGRFKSLEEAIAVRRQAELERESIQLAQRRSSENPPAPDRGTKDNRKT